MGAKNHHFQLLNGRKVVADTVCTFQEIRRMGDTMATKQDHRVKVQAFNQPLNQWDYLGVFLGHRNFLNWDGETWTIDEDYNGMKIGRKEVAAV